MKIRILTSNDVMVGIMEEDQENKLENTHGGPNIFNPDPNDENTGRED